MDIFICPMCKQENGEHQKYCLNCGTWLLNPTFPAKKKEKLIKKTAKFGLGSVVALLIIVGVVWYFGGNNSPVMSANNIVFDKIDLGTQFSLSQLEVNPKSGAIMADLTSLEATDFPFELSAVFYDGSETRLGKAHTLITNPLSAGQTTTLDFKLEEPVNLEKIKKVRVELTPLSPLQLLDRAADMIK